MDRLKELIEIGNHAAAVLKYADKNQVAATDAAVESLLGGDGRFLGRGDLKICDKAEAIINGSGESKRVETAGQFQTRAIERLHGRFSPRGTYLIHRMSELLDKSEEETD